MADPEFHEFYQVELLNGTWKHHAPNCSVLVALSIFLFYRGEVTKKLKKFATKNFKA